VGAATVRRVSGRAVTGFERRVAAYRETIRKHTDANDEATVAAWVSRRWCPCTSGSDAWSWEFLSKRERLAILAEYPDVSIPILMAQKWEER
jgi:hypothetical protein